jgi:hypothetical protein
MTDTPTPETPAELAAKAKDALFDIDDHIARMHGDDRGGFKPVERLRAAIDRLATLAASSTAPAGFVLVPVEPTRVMRQAAFEAASSPADWCGLDDMWDAALAAAPAAAERKPDGWLPIETAPKDGTEVLAWREDCGSFIASYTSADAFPMSQEEIDQCDEDTLFSTDWFTQWPQALRLEGSEVPTHWMPLPAAPAGSEGE